MRLLIIGSILIISTVLEVQSNQQPTVDLPLGKVEGTVKKSLNGRTFYQFEGIPYAQPPVGDNRFKAPIPPKKWIGTLKADTDYKCLQYSHMRPPGGEYPVVGDEDCLYINVYTPNLDTNAKYDVIVYIHGGAFMYKMGSFRSEYIMDKNVVVVNFNYRLGPLGFLSTESDLVPGNNGIRDQNMALQWVKKYIEYFGGNPNSVTIVGTSAGGASTHIHQLIPISKGLIHRAFSQSGCALNPWVLMEKPLEKTKKLAEIVGCNQKNIEKIIECLQSRSGRQIVEAVQHFQPWLYNPFSPFGVVVDSKWSSDPVFPDHPYNLIKNGKIANDVPWIVSMTSAEGLYPVAEFYHDNYIEDINNNWNEIMPFLLDYNYTTNPESRDIISEKIKEYYMNNQKVTKDNFDKFVEISSDRIFLNGLEQASKMQNSVIKSPVYVYYFDYRGVHSLTEYLMHADHDIGVSHADDTSYLYKTVIDTTTTENDRKMIDLFVNMVTSFAKTGKPKVSVDWPPLEKKSDKYVYLTIKSADDLLMESEDLFKNRKFWDSLPINENEKLYPVKDEL